MRTHPIGTGPFKFVEFKAERIRSSSPQSRLLEKGTPYLDGIEYTIIPNRSTAILAFVAGKFDMTFPTEVTIPLLKDVKAQAPKAICERAPNNVSTNLIVNRDIAAVRQSPISARQWRSRSTARRSSTSCSRASRHRRRMLPPPDGIWGMPQEMLETIPGYGPDVQKPIARKPAS